MVFYLLINLLMSRHLIMTCLGRSSGGVLFMQKQISTSQEFEAHAQTTSLHNTIKKDIRSRSGARDQSASACRDLQSKGEAPGRGTSLAPALTLTMSCLFINVTGTTTNGPNDQTNRIINVPQGVWGTGKTRGRWTQDDDVLFIGT